MRFFVLFFLCCSATTLLRAQVILDEEGVKLDLAPYVQVLASEPGTLQISEVAQKEFPPATGQDALRLLDPDKEYWLRVTLSLDAEAQKKRWLVVLPELRIPEVDFFTASPQGGWQVQHAGLNVPVHKKIIRHHTQAFEPHFNESGQQVFYLRYRSPGLPLKIALYSRNYFAFQRNVHFIVFGLFVGVLLFIFSNSFFHWYNQRQGLYLRYCCIVLAYFVLVIGINGGGAYTGLSGEWIAKILGGCVFTVAILFSSYILRFFSVASSSAWRKGLYAHSGLSSLGLLVVLFMPLHSKTITVFSQVVGLSILLLLCTMMLTKLRNNKQSRIFLLAFGSFFILAALESLSLNTALAYPFGISYLNFAVMAEVSILSYSLSQRNEHEKINLREDRQKAQEELLRSVREKQRLVSEQNKMLELRVQERTEELYAKNRQLEIFQNRIQHSIQAAKQIQEALLPEKKHFEATFPNSFVLYLPKDVVAGDFWWYAQVNNQHLVAVLDCTGHGVPGAFMTLIAYSLLENITQYTQDPAEILEKLDESVDTFLGEKGKNLSGMDAGLVALTPQENATFTLTFSGARRPLLYSQERALLRQDGTRRSIGSSRRRKVPFEAHMFQLQKGEMLYLFSDGFADQNDAERKRLGTKVLFSFLSEIQALKTDLQRRRLKRLLRNHMEGTEQRDDIVFVGWRL